MFLLNGKPLSLDRAFTDINGIQRPANWLRLSSPEDLEKAGISEVPDPPSWDQRFYWGYDDDGQLIPKDHEQLIEQWTATTRTTAGTLLAPTDWLITREADTGAPCPPEIRAWRQSIRDVSAQKVDAIKATTDTAELAEYLTSSGIVVTDPDTEESTINSSNAYATWPPQPKIQSASNSPDYRSFYNALLISPAYTVIRSKAVDTPSVLTACVEFIAAIGDAKSGRPNPEAIQTCIDLLCAAAQFSAEELQTLSDVMQVGGLDQLYTLNP